MSVVQFRSLDKSPPYCPPFVVSSHDHILLTCVPMDAYEEAALLEVSPMPEGSRPLCSDKLDLSRKTKHRLRYGGMLIMREMLSNSDTIIFYHKRCILVVSAYEVCSHSA
ncbi:hypothetical protein CYLTODRAFT_426385 [Cylindrobasidium torrendii FP15055 ss-10]|uniref:Uncharacterized protein n=1 Tax=Cylindrobasidium torrendii FP15055 ss-10 TaxID=1314674 RepID=A0A0D7AYP4_9AGAR|nr:hypothetical protein CYLTODRAFT_426385 [Cylindrobasidium torrendii FP15055 ss-10]